MHGPDGTDYENKAIYHQVDPCAHLVYDHGGNDDRPPLFRVTATFAEVKGQTRLELRFALPTPEAAEQTRQFIKKAGGESTWDRLAEYLAEESTGKRMFVINRSFDAPIERMYQMWTDPAHLSRCMLAPSTERLARPDRIVYVQNFCDESETLSRHPLAPTWPAYMLTQVTLTG